MKSPRPLFVAKPLFSPGKKKVTPFYGTRNRTRSGYNFPVNAWALKNETDRKVTEDWFQKGIFVFLFLLCWYRKWQTWEKPLLEENACFCLLRFVSFISFRKTKVRVRFDEIIMSFKFNLIFFLFWTNDFKVISYLAAFACECSKMKSCCRFTANFACLIHLK